MKYLSLFSGIEAATVAWHPLGWEPVAFAEIEKFPCAVLAHHYPHVPNYGDVSKFKEWSDARTDIIVGGSPCQAFSVAGLRKGLADPRGNLTLTYLAVVAKYRPRWVVWENVPGVLSDDSGRTFGTFLGALGQLGYGFAYRVLDAQYVRVDGFARAVPQRRRRVFVVGYFGDWRRAGAVLFERESLQGNIAPSQKEAETGTRGIISRTRSGSGSIPSVAGTLMSRTSSGGWSSSVDFAAAGDMVPVGFSSTGIAKYKEGVGTLRAKGGDAGLGSETLAVFRSKASASQSMNPDVVAPSLDVGKCDGLATIHGLRVRRLMPIECERLQGFPDHYTLIKYGKKSAADTPRYKALGNSMAVNVMRWIGRRIAEVDSISIDCGMVKNG